MISCRFFDDFFRDCLMILRCFRWVFFKNVLLAAAPSTFSFLDTQTFLCLFLAFSIPRGEVGENVCRQRWLGACPCRLGWERVASVAVPLSFLCSLKCCLVKKVLLAASGRRRRSSFSDQAQSASEPMTTVPSIDRLLSAFRIASTAA